MELLAFLAGIAATALAHRYAKRSTSPTVRKIDAVIMGGGGPGEPHN